MINTNRKLITCIALVAALSLSGIRITQAENDSDSDLAPPKPAAAAPQASAPVDIVADEQEFATDAVIAKGKVRVVYKDSTILAPLATLYKDETGNPNRAVFTGHPRLTQPHSKIDANMLTMELQKSKILAVGGAHSEVDIPEDEKDNGLTSPAKKTDSKMPAPPNVLDKGEKTVAKAESDDEDKPATSAENTPGTASSDSTAGSPAAGKKEGGADKPPEKIITDSERQEFDQANGRFDCIGKVHVINGDMIIDAEKMQVIYGAVSNKPETCLFTGSVVAKQGKNTTYADFINYSLSTKRLQASGNVKSKVIQDKPKEDPNKKKDTASVDILPSASASTTKKGSVGASSIAKSTDENNDKPFWIFSDSQDYNRDGGRMAAQGNVKVINGDMNGVGPSVVLTKKPDGRADKVYFVGRSQVTQPQRRWIGDEITYVVDTKMVVANGHAMAMVIQTAEEMKPKRKTIQDDAPASPANKNNERLAQPKPTGVVSQGPEPKDKRSISVTNGAIPK
jgi:lipopolysaccharide export system protein LptA